jgi:hypothetical protein
VSASTILSLFSLTGTLSSATTGTFGITNDFALYAVNATNSTRFDTVWTYRQPMTVIMSNTNSFAATVGSDATASVTFSSNASAGFASNLMGIRMGTVPYLTTISQGLYMMGIRQSTSSGGYSALIRSYNPIYDNPVPVGKGFFGQSSATSIGYNDAGVYGTGAGPAIATTNAFPASVGYTNIVNQTDIVPYFRMGAISN